MIARYEDELVCDLAETYGILNHRQLPARKVAVFACGLGQNSRVVRRMTGSKVSLDTFLLATIADATRFNAWAKTKSAKNGTNRPKSMAEMLSPEKEKTGAGFSSADEYKAWRARMIGENANGK